MLKRLAAMFYDGLCLFSLFFLATLILVVYTNSEAINDNNLIYNLIYKLFLFFIAYFYFVWHWVNGGRTLGLRAWHIKLVSRGMDQMNWRNATVRFCLALLSFISFGLGFAWAFFDKDKLTFHDRYSNTRLINDKN